MKTEKYLNYVPYQNVKELPPLFVEMIGNYPARTGELKRQDSPSFYHNDRVGLAIKQANGCSNIPHKVSLLIDVIDKMDLYSEFGGFLTFCDTDLKDREGAIEKLLLECANLTYNKLYQDAQDYRNRIMTDTYSQLRKECWASDKRIQTFYSDNVQFGAISSVLKPDRPVRFAIKDKILKSAFFDEYMQLAEFKKIHNFLLYNII